MLANILGMYGRSVAVLEAGDDLIDYPRGVGLDDESFRTIQTVGLVETVLPHTTPHHIMRLVNGAGNVLLVNDPATTELGWMQTRIIQPEVDRALLNGLRRFDDMVVLYGHNVLCHRNLTTSRQCHSRGSAHPGYWTNSRMSGPDTRIGGVE